MRARSVALGTQPFVPALALLALAACHSYRPDPSWPPATGIIGVRYSAPTDVPVEAGDGRLTQVVPTARWLTGRVLDVRGDTLRLRLLDVSPRRYADQVEGLTAVVVRRPGVAFEMRRPSAAKTVVAATAAVVVVGGVIAVRLYLNALRSIGS